jgi:hypothetical protein
MRIIEIKTCERSFRFGNFIKEVENETKSSCSKEIVELFRILSSYFGKIQNPLLQVKMLVEQNNHLKQENESFRQKIVQFENHHQKFESQILHHNNLDYFNS